MVLALRVRDETATGKATGEFTISALDDRCTLRDLVRTRVREEVARHNASPRRVFRGFVQPLDTTATPDGYELIEVRQLEWEEQAAAAERAFSRNGFFVLVDGRQVVDLDEVITLSADSTVSFVRLVPLVGG